MSRFPSVSDALELLVPRVEEERNWEEVVRRAGPLEPRPGGRPKLVAALAVVALVVGAGATPHGRAVVAAAIERFGGWVSGDVGTPAPAEQQAAFEERNRKAFAQFPETTKLRLLLSREAAGQRFDLFGFRHGSWWCLRVVRAVRSDARGSNACVPSARLAANTASAVVAGEARFRVGVPEQTVEGVFGIVATGVRSIEVTRARSGTTTTQAESNAFMTLRARPSGTVATHPSADSIVGLAAVRDDGSREELDFVGRLRVDPGVPGYFRPGPFRTDRFAGPKRVEATASGDIGWIRRREPRGERLDPEALGFPFRRLRERGHGFPLARGEILLSRSVQPDPSNPTRIGIVYVRDRGELYICNTEFRPLERRVGGISCRFAFREPLGLLSIGSLWMDAYGPQGPQFQSIAGLASDGVASLSVVFRDGAEEPVVLRENTFTISLPFAELPAKLVARDGEGRVVALQMLPGPPILARCPRPRPVRVTRAPRPYERLDLGALTLNGHEIFARGIEDVRAALGPAQFGRRPGSRQELYYGGRDERDFDVKISFARVRGKFLADSISIREGAATDERVGQLLAHAPQTLQARIERMYPQALRLETAYGSEPGRGCVARFKGRRERLTITLQLDPRSGRTSVYITRQ
jgi:hypothetical protein